MLATIIQWNYIAVTVTLSLILFVMTNNNFEQRINRSFLAVALCVLLLSISETWEALLALRAEPSVMRVICSAVGYSLRPMVPFLMAQITFRMTRARFALFTLPLVCNVLVVFSALFCDIAFSYSQTNEYVRGPLGYMPFVVATFYVAGLLVLLFRNRRGAKKKEMLIVSALALIAVISTILESQFHVRFIQNPSIATSLTFYYLFLQSEHNNLDPLTGARTRRRFYLDAAKYRNALSAVVSLDLNDLKKLNDEYGHVAGDKALITVANVIAKHMGPRAALYRIGGDEFMILCYKRREDEVRAMVAAIEGGLAETPYRCAIGYDLYSMQQEFDAVCNRADTMMYENKRQMKCLAEQQEKALPC